MVMWKMVLLFSCLVVCTNLLQYCQTTRQQNNKSVWKTVPSEARVTRDEVSGLRTKRKQLSRRQYLWLRVVGCRLDYTILPATNNQ